MYIFSGLDVNALIVSFTFPTHPKRTTISHYHFLSNDHRLLPHNEIQYTNPRLISKKHRKRIIKRYLQS
ncbi:hypothetical protein Hanom_Chr17g01579841 [Helianthus anomalus]